MGLEGSVAVYIASWKGGGVLSVHCHLYIDGVCPNTLFSSLGILRKKKKTLEGSHGEKLWVGEGPRLVARAETGEKK